MIMKYADFLKSCDDLMKEVCADEGVDYNEFVIDLADAYNKAIDRVENV